MIISFESFWEKRVSSRVVEAVQHTILKMLSINEQEISQNKSYKVGAYARRLRAHFT